MDNEIDPQVKNLVSAIGRAETGNPTLEAYTQKGASGEFGRYQFTPDTWKGYAQETLGNANAPMTIENQNRVAYNKVKQWKDAGYNPAQIASMWNAGPGKPNAYNENYKGVNSFGVSYDTPAYAAKVSQYYNELKGNTQTPPLDTTTTAQTPIQNGTPDILGGVIPKAGQIDAELSNMPGTLGAIGSGIYNAGKGLLNLGKDAVVDIFKTIQHPVDTIGNVVNTVGEELAGGANPEHLDSIGKLLQSTLGSKGALGVGQEIGNLVNDTIGTTKDTFSGGKLAGNTLNSLMAVLLAETGGQVFTTEAGIKTAIDGAVKNNIITDTMGQFMTKYASQLAQVSKAGAFGSGGAGFQVGSNLQEGRPIGENTKQAFFAGAVTPGIIEGTGNLISKIPVKVPFTSNTTDFKSAYDKAFPPNTKETKVGPERYERANDLMNYIVNAKDYIKIEDEKGNIKSPSQYTVQDNLNALKKIQPTIYKSYTSILKGADLEKFKSNIQSGADKIISDLESKLETTISKPNQTIIQNMIDELKSDQMKNATPETLQDHIQDIGRRAFSGSMNEGKSILADVGAKLKNVLGGSLDKLDSNQYNELKNLYRASKEAERGWSTAALKELKGTPDFMTKLTNLGMSAEGINFLITHDPQALAVSIGLKGLTMWQKWLKNPNRAMQKIYRNIEKNPFQESTIPKEEPTKETKQPVMKKSKTSESKEAPMKFVSSVGKLKMPEVMVKLSDMGYNKDQITQIMGKLFMNNDTNVFDPEEIKIITDKIKPAIKKKTK